MTDMQAAVGLAQLGKLRRFVGKRRENHRMLSKGLAKFEKYFILPQATPGSVPSWFGYVLTIRDNAPFARKQLLEHLEANKVGTRLLFGGNIIRQPAYKDVKFKIVGKLVNSNVVMNQTFWIGCYPAIDRNCVDYIVSVFEKFLAKYR